MYYNVIKAMIGKNTTYSLQRAAARCERGKAASGCAPVSRWGESVVISGILPTAQAYLHPFSSLRIKSYKSKWNRDIAAFVPSFGTGVFLFYTK